jgi:hypothetical protein
MNYGRTYIRRRFTKVNRPGQKPRILQIVARSKRKKAP